MFEFAGTQKRTAKALVLGYNTWTIDAMLAPRASDCVHAELPASVGVPARNDTEITEHFEAAMSYFQDFNIGRPIAVLPRIRRLTDGSLLNDPNSHRAAAYVKSSAESPVGP